MNEANDGGGMTCGEKMRKARTKKTKKTKKTKCQVGETFGQEAVTAVVSILFVFRYEKKDTRKPDAEGLRRLCLVGLTTSESSLLLGGV
jgi:hypothetical protein